METYSITISPRGDIQPKWREVLVKWCEKNTVKYIIGNEKGANENDHLQIAICIKNRRSDNIRRSIFNLLKYKPDDDAESKHWLKIAKHDDEDYLFGYCCKENDYKTNIDKVELDEYRDYYGKMKIKKVIGKWECKSINQLFDFCRNWVKQCGNTRWKWNDGGIGKTIKSYPSLKIVIMRIHSEGLIPLSLALKYKPFMESLWKDYYEFVALDDLISNEWNE